MYRDPPPDFPPPPDPRLVEPDRGLRDLWVGRATPDDVLRVFGSDCKIARHDNRDIFSLNYSYLDDEQYKPDRPPQSERPDTFNFEFGLLKQICVGPYQTALRTTGHLAIGAARRDVIRVFGGGYDLLLEQEFETLRYRTLGIQLAIDNDDDKVMNFSVFRAAR